jgi:hypothetical protein
MAPEQGVTATRSTDATDGPPVEAPGSPAEIASFGVRWGDAAWVGD